MRYKDTKKIVVLSNGKPQLRKKKVSSGGTRKKKKGIKTQYATNGKLKGIDTPKFDVSRHRKLTVNDFDDPLDSAKWDVWYYNQFVQLATKKVTEQESVGKTPEERRTVAENLRGMDAMDAMIVRAQAEQNPVVKAALEAKLSKWLASVSAK